VLTIVFALTFYPPVLGVPIDSYSRTLRQLCVITYSNTSSNMRLAHRVSCLATLSEGLSVPLPVVKVRDHSPE
jgi:hypothetical protein